MSIQIGDVNLVQSALDLEFRVLALEGLVDYLLRTRQITIPQNEVEIARKKAVEKMQGKYPAMGIKNL